MCLYSAIAENSVIHTVSGIKQGLPCHILSVNMAGVNNFIPFTPSYTFHFERTFDADAAHVWMQQNWTLSFWYAALYVVLVFGGRYYMSNRAKFDLRVPLVIWSSVLAVFSICGAIRTIPEMIFMLRVNGLEGSVCDPTSLTVPGSSFWAFLFAVSKVYELGDTAFIVLRKQPLIFLHWYHHITVLVYSWYGYSDHTAVGRWFLVMNYIIHSFMYSYYALRAMRFRVPKTFSILITCLQISQMILGIFVVAKAYQYKSQGHFCQQTWQNMQYSALMYASYLLLFIRFFFNAYLIPKTADVGRKSSQTVGNNVGNLDVSHANGSAIINGNHMNGSVSDTSSSFMNNNASKLYGNDKKID